MRRVAVLTTFVELHAAYSLCNVVEPQVRVLLENGYDTTFVACEGFRPDGVYWHPDLKHWRIPRYVLEDDAEAVERRGDFEAGVAVIVAALRPLIRHVDVAITHDFAYLSNFLAYNHACRRLAREFPSVTWLHFIHSAPWPNPGHPDEDPRGARFRPFDNSFIVYPNAEDCWRVAAQYAMAEDYVVVVPHPIDWERSIGFHPLTRALVHAYDLYTPDVLAIYPIRMDRGKQPEKLVRLFGALKAEGATVRLVIINFHSNRDEHLDYRDEIIREAETLGLTSRDFVFTNTIHSLPGISPRLMAHYRFEFPYKVVQDLFQLTNVYAHPSTSESYSLVCQEAAACGNLLFLNADVPAMRAIYGEEAQYVHFSAGHGAGTSGHEESQYYSAVAQEILVCLRSERTTHLKTRLRQTRNPQAVFREWLEPLLYRSAEPPRRR